MNGTVRQRAWQLVKSGDAANFSDACRILAKHAAAKRQATKRKTQRVAYAQSQWWNR